MEKDFFDGLDEVKEKLRSRGGKEEAAGEGEEARWRILSEISALLNSPAYPFEEILDLILDQTIRLTGADRGFIMLYNDRDALEVKIARNMNMEDMAAEDLRISRSVVDEVVSREDGICIANIEDDKKFSDMSSIIRLKILSVMCVPLISRSKTRGVIYIDSVNRPYGFRKEDLSLVTALSSPAAIAIENALLYANSEKVIEERTKSLMETEKKLRESEARFKAMFDNMSSGVTVFEVKEGGKDFSILDLNRADERIEGIRKKDILGKSARSVFPNLENMGLLCRMA